MTSTLPKLKRQGEKGESRRQSGLGRQMLHSQASGTLNQKTSKRGFIDRRRGGRPDVQSKRQQSRVDKKNKESKQKQLGGVNVENEADQ